jgi:hypothetical protein
MNAIDEKTQTQDVRDAPIFKALLEEGWNRRDAIESLTDSMTMYYADDNSMDRIYQANNGDLYFTDMDTIFEVYERGSWMVGYNDSHIEILAAARIEDLCHYNDTRVDDIVEILRGKGIQPQLISLTLATMVVEGDHTWVNGLLCDPDTATVLGEAESGCDDAENLDFYACTIYKAPEGHFFARGGGARSLFGGEYLQRNSWYGQSNVTLLLDEEVIDDLLRKK